MRFVPTQPDSDYPTWESAFGLFSFQIAAVLSSSFVIAVVPSDPTVSVLVSGGLTVFAAFLYALLAESQTPGSLRQPRFRRALARRAAFLTSLVALLPMVAFRLVEIKVSTLSRDGLYVGAFLIWGLFVLPWLEMWVGLTVAAWLKGRAPRS